MLKDKVIKLLQKTKIKDAQVGLTTSSQSKTERVVKRSNNLQQMAFRLLLGF